MATTKKKPNTSPSSRATVTPEMVDAFVTEFKTKGTPVLQLAKNNDLSPSVIRYWLNKNLDGLSIGEWNQEKNPAKKELQKKIADARLAYDKGRSIKDIAQENGWGVSTTYRRLNVDPNRHPDASWVPDAFDDYQNGASYREIAERYARNRSTATGCIQKHYLKMDPEERKKLRRHPKVSDAIIAKTPTRTGEFLG